MDELDSKRIKREFAERLNEALDDMKAPPKHKGRQRHLAKLMQMTPKGAARWLEGNGLPRPEDQVRLAAKVKVRLEWLIFNLGAKRDEVEDRQKTSTQLLQNIIEAVDQAVERVGGLDATTKAKLASILYELLKRS